MVSDYQSLVRRRVFDSPWKKTRKSVNELIIYDREEEETVILSLFLLLVAPLPFYCSRPFHTK